MLYVAIPVIFVISFLLAVRSLQKELKKLKHSTREMKKEQAFYLWD